MQEVFDIITQFWAHKSWCPNFDKLNNEIFNNYKFDNYKLMMINYKLTLITIKTKPMKSPTYIKYYKLIF